MLKNFEHDTCPLNDYEKNKLLPAVVRVLERCKGRERAITNKKMIHLYLDDYAVDPVRLRKVLHYIRTKHLIEGLMATGRGYYIAQRREELDNYLKSLEGRMNALKELWQSIIRQRDKLFPEKKE